MTERQKTGLWFIITGLLVLSGWFFSYGVVSFMTDSEIGALGDAMNNAGMTDRELYVLGVANVVAMQSISLVGVPLVIAGAAQMALGRTVPKKKSKK